MKVVAQEKIDKLKKEQEILQKDREGKRLKKEQEQKEKKEAEEVEKQEREAERARDVTDKEKAIEKVMPFLCHCNYVIDFALRVQS